MKFSDNIDRTSLEDVFVIRTSEEMEAREEYNSNLWNLERENFLLKDNNIYKTVVRDVKIGENIYTKSGKLIAYRSNLTKTNSYESLKYINGSDHKGTTGSVRGFPKPD